jgi:alkaline phosphatase D
MRSLFTVLLMSAVAVAQPDRDLGTHSYTGGTTVSGGLMNVGLPTTDAAKPLTRIVFGSCNDQDKPCPAWDAIFKQNPELLILLGDTIYADLDKSRKVTTQVIKDQYDKLDAVPAFKKLKETVPLMGVWDDHDYGKNDAGADFPLKDESQQVLLDFYGVPKDSPRRTQKGVYHSAVFGPEGKRVQVILLDGRYFLTGTTKGKYDTKLRTTPYIPNSDPAATFLGDEQWAWLKDQLKVPAEVRLIGSGIQVLAEDHPWEKWANLPKEREKLYALLKETQANGVVILSGDRHLAELSLDTKAIGYPLYDITSSGFNQGNKSWRPPEVNRHRVAAVPFGNNYGAIAIDWTRETSPLVTLALHGEEGEVLVRHDIRAGMLTPNAQVAKEPKGDKPAAEPKALPEGVITAADAAKKVGEKVTVQFEVIATGSTKDNKRVFLNADKDRNFTVVLSGKLLTEGKWKDKKPDDYKGKSVRVKGTVTEFNKKPQIVVEAEGDLELVE